jgi:hypothetical protein
VLKKAGIVVATSAAGILAFTPLAFAGSSDHDANKHYGKGHEHSKVETNDVSEGNLTNDCAFGNQGGSPTAGALGGDNGLLGAVSLVTSLATDVTGQLNTLNCNNINVSDLVDNNSNNRRSTESQTHVDDSFNTEGHHR